MGSNNDGDSGWHRHPLFVGIVAPCVAGGLLWQFGLGGSTTSPPADSAQKAIPMPSSGPTMPQVQSSSASTQIAAEHVARAAPAAAVPASDPVSAQVQAADSGPPTPASPAIGIIERICRSGRITIDFDFDRQGMVIPDPGGARTIRVRNCDVAGGTFDTIPEGVGGTNGGSGHATPYTLAFDFFLYDPGHSSPMRCAISARNVVARTFDGKVKCTYTYRTIPTYDVAVAI